MHICIHGLPPFRSVNPHEEYHRAAREADQTKDSEQPSIPNSANDRSSHHTANAREDVSHEVVQGYTLGGLLRHELCQHGSYHTKDEHGSHAKEKVGDHLLGES